MRAALTSLLAQPLAHRGLHDRSHGIIENSIAAAEAAVVAGYGIECDIQISSDGEAIVFHDETLDRLTSDTGRVDARPAADLTAITLKDADATIPSLARFLRSIGGRAPLVIEIKSRFDGDMRLATRALELIAGYTGIVALKSFDAAVIEHCRNLAAPCPLGLVGPDERAALPNASTIYDFVSWRVSDLATLRAAYLQTPAMSWTVRSRDEHMIARRYAAQIVFERYAPE